MQLQIIAIDDQEFNLLVLEEMTRQIGMEINTFLDPMEAYAYLQTTAVDLMLTDYMMPQMDGIELIRKAKQIDPELICVMLTAVSDNQELKIDALEAGATDFMTKPVNIAELQAKLRNLSQLKASQNILKDFNTALKNEVERATQALIQREHEALRVLSATAEYRDPETGSHIARVANCSKMLARLCGLSQYE